jgi:hypothetical protein
MGRGCAREAKAKYPGIQRVIGRLIRCYGNVPVLIEDCNIITLPVKHNWWELANIKLIEANLPKLVNIADHLNAKSIVMPRPGCGNGGLDWQVVRPICLKYLDDRFSVITWR